MPANASFGYAYVVLGTEANYVCTFCTSQHYKHILFSWSSNSSANQIAVNMGFQIFANKFVQSIHLI